MADEKLQEGLKLIIPLATYRKIMAYTTIADTEISGFAEVEYVESRNAFVAGEVYLLKQEAGGSSVHMDEETVSKFNLERIKAGATQLPRLWWHSHVNMETFFSVTDEDTLKDLQNDTFIIGLVTNKRKAMKAKTYLYNEVQSKVMGIQFNTTEQIEVDPLPVSIEFDYERIPDALRKEVEEKVKTRVYTPTPQLPYSVQHNQYEVGKKKERGHASIIKPLFLPKDRTAATKRIEDKGLEREWDADKGEFIYRDPYSGDVWVDYWAALEDFEERTDWKGDN